MSKPLFLIITFFVLTQCDKSSDKEEFEKNPPPLIGVFGYDATYRWVLKVENGDNFIEGLDGLDDTLAFVNSSGVMTYKINGSSITLAPVFQYVNEVVFRISGNPTYNKKYVKYRYVELEPYYQYIFERAKSPVIFDTYKSAVDFIMPQPGDPNLVTLLRW